MRKRISKRITDTERINMHYTKGSDIISNVNKITDSAMKPAEISIRITRKTRTETLRRHNIFIMKENLKIVNK